MNDGSLTAEFTGVGTVSKVLVNKTLDGYYVMFTTGTVTAQRFSVNIIRNFVTIASFKCSSGGNSLFRNSETVEIEISKEK